MKENGEKLTKRVTECSSSRSVPYIPDGIRSSSFLLLCFSRKIPRDQVLFLPVRDAFSFGFYFFHGGGDAAAGTTNERDDDSTLRIIMRSIRKRSIPSLFSLWEFCFVSVYEMEEQR